MLTPLLLLLCFAPSLLTLLLLHAQVVRSERHSAAFSRSFMLPDNINEEAISASLDKGVLTLTLPKAEPDSQPGPKRITVNQEAPLHPDSQEGAAATSAMPQMEKQAE